jgi:lantibiotic modifying enzyme
MKELEKILFKSLEDISIELFPDQFDDNPGIAGNAGVALYFSYLHLLTREDKHASQASRLIENSVINLNKALDNSFAGTAGVAWVVQHLVNIGILDESTTENLIDIDKFLDDTIKIDLEAGDYDLFHGLIGKGIYYIERYQYKKSNDIVRTIKKIIDGLNSISEKSNEGITWRYKIGNELNEHTHSLGLAHGIPSIISFLSSASKLNLDLPIVNELIAGASEWLLKKRIDNNQFSFHSYTSPDLEEGENGSSRLAWCNGDLGVSIALLSASKTINSELLYKEAINIAIKTCNRDLKDSGVFQSNGFVDPNFCHGISGIAHIYGRLFKITGLDIFLYRHKYWLQELMNHRVEGCGIAGFVSDIWMSFDPIKGKAVKKWGSSPSLVTGTAGVGLVLLSALKKNAANWDKMFFTNI